jgi:hypothetical protein
MDDSQSPLRQLMVQLRQCMQSYTDVTAALSSHPDNEPLITARCGLADTLLVVNKMKETCEHSCTSSTSFIAPGSLVLAPRLFDGLLCMDAAFVMDDDNSDNLVNIETDTIRGDPDDGATTGVLYGDSVKISWVWPLSRYEQRSLGSTFSLHQIKTGSHISAFLEWQLVSHKFCYNSHALRN